MKKIEYRTYDKSTWGPGPWQDEPDKVQWMDEATGLPCLAVRGPKFSGHWCGYVGVPEGHPLFGSDYSGTIDDRVPKLTVAAMLEERGVGDLYKDDLEKGEVRVESILDAHGGITFADSCSGGAEDQSICHLPEEGEPDHVWWFGFDCAHAYDYSPALFADGTRLSDIAGRRTSVYRDLAYVQAQCADLARQLHEITNPKG